MTSVTSENKLHKICEKAKRLDQKSPKRAKLNYFIFYTISFCICASLVFSTFILMHKSFLWSFDGYKQHYPSLVFFHDWLRGILSRLVHTGKLTVTMWSSQIGLGGDVINSLNYYVIGDPFQLLCILCPAKYFLILYNLLCLLRMYCAGLAFSAFCFRMKKGRFATLIGSICYVFCGYTMYFAIRHPFFELSMVYLPLLLLGVEKILSKESPKLFVFMVFISAISNFYLFYMLSIFTFIYSAVRFFDYHKEQIFKNIGKCLVKFIASYLIGIALAAFIFLPVVIGFFGFGRVGTSGDKNLLYYSYSYYTSFALNMFSPSMGSSGIAPLAFFAVILMFIRKNKKDRSMKILFFIGIVFLLIPVFGYVFNGFNYVSDRWTFAFILIMSFITVTMIPKLSNISKKEFITFLIVTFVFASTFFIIDKNNQKYYVFVLSLMAVTFIVLLLLNLLRKTRLSIPTRNIIFKSTIFVMAIVLVYVSSIALYSKGYKNYTSQFEKAKNTAWYKPTTKNDLAKVPKDNEFYRIDDKALYETDNNPKGTTKSFSYNLGMLYHYDTTSGFLSTFNSNIYNYFKLVGSTTADQTPSFIGGFDKRTILNALGGVKYYTTSHEETHLPFGYSQVTTVKDGVKQTIPGFYQNDYFLPLGYTYSSYMLTDDFMKMNEVERQNAMMQTVMLDKPVLGYTKDTSYKPQTYSVPCSLVPDDNIKLGKNSFTISKKKSTLTINFKGKPNSEMYLKFSGVDVALKQKSDIDLNINVASADNARSILYRTSRDNFCCGLRDFIVNLGYSTDAQTSCTLTFNTTAKVTYDNLSIICNPMDSFPNEVSALKQNTLQNVKITTNKITGDISLDKPKLMCVQMPYSNGWTAHVNGKKTDIIQGNGLYMIIPLQAGYSKISLTYETPFFNAGLIISGITLFLCIIALCMLRMHKREKEIEKVASVTIIR
ncbi:MAG: YfhO family protein [Bacillota bacterium]|nr:YfhO family protein [Bacillota bacterium]